MGPIYSKLAVLKGNVLQFNVCAPNNDVGVDKVGFVIVVVVEPLVGEGMRTHKSQVREPDKVALNGVRLFPRLADYPGLVPPFSLDVDFIRDQVREAFPVGPFLHENPLPRLSVLQVS